MPPRPPAPPSFYSNVAQMQSPGGAGAAGGQQPGGSPTSKKAGEDEVEIVKTLFRVFEKWRKAAGGDQKKTDLIQKMADTLEQYNNQFVKTDTKSGADQGSKEEPQPTPTEGQGPTPAAAGAAGGMETQPVPA
jgi:hypothetical protein